MHYEIRNRAGVVLNTCPTLEDVVAASATNRSEPDRQIAAVHLADGATTPTVWILADFSDQAIKIKPVQGDSISSSNSVLAKMAHQLRRAVRLRRNRQGDIWEEQHEN